MSGNCKQALLGAENQLAPILDLTIAYGRAARARVEALAPALDVRVGVLPDRYTAAVQWSGSIIGAA